MARKIVIKGCDECPHRDHAGAFAAVSYVPLCQETNRSGENRHLPYTVGESHGIVTASGTNIIPDWCPLEEDK